jgi:DNA-binding response OmpR family regulator
MSTTQSREAVEASGSGSVHDDTATVTVLVYSDDVTTRERIRLALGRRPAADLPRVEVIECATGHAVIESVDRGGIDLLILDGEAAPTGGMGICRQLKNEIYECPPVLLIIGRKDDAWLAAWSRADGVVSHPIDGVTLAPVAADLLRRRLSAQSHAE